MAARLPPKGQIIRRAKQLSPALQKEEKIARNVKLVQDAALGILTSGVGALRSRGGRGRFTRGPVQRTKGVKVLPPTTTSVSPTESQLPAVSRPRPTIINAASGPFGILFLDIEKGVKPSKAEVNDLLSGLGFAGRHTIVELKGGIATKAGDTRRFRIDLDEAKRFDSKDVVRKLGFLRGKDK